MNFEKSIAKIIIKSNNTDFNHPQNTFNITESSGSGVFISNSLILTCYHVVKGAIDIEIIYKKINIIKGVVKYVLPDDDLAVIEIEPQTDVIILEFEVINNKLSDEVIAVGFPLSSDSVIITRGIISGYRDSLIQTDATLNSGNSGGPLLIASNDTYKIIGINVSKFVDNAENTGFVVPIYRFKIAWPDLDKVIYKKPILYFDFQKIKQKKLRQEIFGTNNINAGIRVSLINKNYYIAKYFDEDDVLLTVNLSEIDINGNIKFDFFPEKISINDLGLWFKPGDIIELTIFNYKTKQIESKQITLEIIKTNILDFYDFIFEPSYFIENNGLILSILSKQHLKSFKELNLSGSQLLKLLDRTTYQKDIFTVYLVDIIYSKLTFNSLPLGDIITEINDSKFKDYNDFIEITKTKITKIRTINNDIFYIE